MITKTSNSDAHIVLRPYNKGFITSGFVFLPEASIAFHSQFLFEQVLTRRCGFRHQRPRLVPLCAIVAMSTSQASHPSPALSWMTRSIPLYKHPISWG